MENFIRSKKYWDLVETGFEEPEDNSAILTPQEQKKNDDRRLKDMNAKNYLFQAIDCAISEIIIQRDTSKNIWDSMKK